MGDGKKEYSRRDFARNAALLSVAAPLAGAPAVAAAEILNPTDDQPQNLPADFPKLSDQSRAEAEERYKTIVTQYGGRFSEAQKADLRRLCYVAQPPLDRLRTYAIRNGDSPALYLKPTVDRDKRPAKAAQAVQSPAAKKP